MGAHLCEAYHRIGRALAAGESVIFDHVNVTRAERDRVRALAAQFGPQVQILYVPITAAEARARLRANRETRKRSDVRDEDFDQVVDLFESPVGEPDVVVRGLLRDSVPDAG